MRFEKITTARAPTFRRLPVSTDNRIRTFRFLTDPRPVLPEEKATIRTPAYVVTIEVDEANGPVRSTVAVPETIARQLLAVGGVYIGQTVIFRDGEVLRVVD